MRSKDLSPLSLLLPELSHLILHAMNEERGESDDEIEFSVEDIELIEYRKFLISNLLSEIIPADESNNASVYIGVSLDENTVDLITDIAEQSVRDGLTPDEYKYLAVTLKQSIAAALDAEEYLLLTPEAIDEMSDEEYQQTVLEIAQGIVSALDNNPELPIKTRERWRRISKLILFLIIAVLFLAACGSVEPAVDDLATRTTLAPEDDDDDSTGGDGGDDGGNGPPDEEEPTPTPVPQPTGTPEPEPEPTATPTIPDAESIEVIASDDVLREFHAKFVEFLFTNEAFVWQFDTNIEFEVYETAIGNVLLAEIVDDFEYQGEKYPEGTHLRFASLDSTEPYFASVEGSQSVIDLAGGVGTVVDITVDLETGQTVAVDADGNVLAQVNLESNQWEINPDLLIPDLPPATVETLLTDTTLDESTILRYLVRPFNTESRDTIAFGPPAEGVEFSDEEMSWEIIVDRSDPAATFYDNMRLYTGFDVEVASRAWEEAPDGYTELAVKYIGHYTADFGEHGTEECAIFQTWIEEEGQVIPLIFAVSLSDAHMLKNFNYLDENFEVKSNSPQSATSIVGNLERANPYMIIAVAIGNKNDAADSFAHGLVTPDDRLPDFAVFNSIHDVLGTEVTSTPAIGAIFAQAQK